MRRIELAWAVCIIAGAVFVLYATSGLVYWQRRVPGPGFVPYWVSLLTIALAAIMLLAAVLRKTDKPAGFPEPRSLLRIGLVYAGLWAVVALAPVIGFVPVAVAFMLVTMLVLWRRPLLPTLLTTAVIALMVEFMFIRWLGVRLPRGLLDL